MIDNMQPVLRGRRRVISDLGEASLVHNRTQALRHANSIL